MFIIMTLRKEVHTTLGARAACGEQTKLILNDTKGLVRHFQWNDDDGDDDKDTDDDKDSKGDFTGTRSVP